MTAATEPGELSYDPFVIIGLAGILFAVVGGIDLVTQASGITNLIYLIGQC
jgi:hypothetical protein